MTTNQQNKTYKIAREFLELATRSWNPDNFDELLELFKLQYPEMNENDHVVEVDEMVVDNQQNREEFRQSAAKEAREEVLREVINMFEKTPGEIHTPIGGFSNIQWISKNEVLAKLQKLTTK